MRCGCNLFFINKPADVHGSTTVVFTYHIQMR
jgi:hypothetical protein